MGVKGLWSLLNPVARPVQIESMEGKRLAIDSSIWLYQFQATMRDKDGRVLVNAHVLGFLRRINKLLFHGIKPVFVFDGGAPVLKRNTIAERKRKRQGAVINHARTAERLFAAQMRREAVKVAQAQREQIAAREAAAAEQVLTRYDDDVGDIISADATYLDDLENRPGPSRSRPPPATSNSASSAPVAPEPLDPAEERRKKFRKMDPYRLPETSMPTVSTEEKPDARLATEEELKQFIDDMKPSDIDIESAEFRALPTEVQYEIIGDLRIRSRQQSHQRLAQMLRGAPTALDFSMAQIKHLSQRNALTQQLLTVTDMVGKAHLTIPVRIAAERNREYVLLKRGEDVGGGWALGIREGSKQKPIEIEEKKEESSEEESDESDYEVTEVTKPPVDKDLAEFRRRQMLDAITARYALKPTARRSLDVPVTPFGASHTSTQPALFDDPDMFADMPEEVTPTANDKALALALQQEELGSDEEEADPDLVKALAMSRRERESGSEGPKTLGVGEDGEASDDSMEEVELVPSERNTPVVTPTEERDDDEFEEVVTSPVKEKEATAIPELESTSRPPLSIETAKPLPETLLPVEPISNTVYPPANTETDSAEIYPPSRLSELNAPESSSSATSRSAAGVATEPIVIDDEDDDMPIFVGMDSDKAMDLSDGFKIRTSKPEVRTRPAKQNAIAHAVTKHASSSKPAPMADPPASRPLIPSRSSSLLNRPSIPSPLSRSPSIIPPAKAESREPSIIPDRLPRAGPSPPSPTMPLSLVEHEPDRLIDEALAGTSGAWRTGSTTPSRSIPDEPPENTDEEDSEGEDLEDSRSIEWSRSPSPTRRRPLQNTTSANSIPSELEPDTEDVDMNAQDMVGEQDDYARFMAQIKNRNLDEVRTEIDDEIRVLHGQNKVAQRDSDEITLAMIAQIQTLLRHFGIPYITAPMEAEAQCAKLAELGLVDGIITDDSDVFLFGGTQCFKNIFNDNKYAECFLSTDINRELSLSRERLISLAYLLGSDYTIGLPGVGPVVALELLANFPGERGIEEFKEWWSRVQKGQDGLSTDNKWKASFKKRYSGSIFITADWPNPLVREAYKYPVTDESEEAFHWGFPKLSALRSFLHEELSWSISKVDDELTPIVQRIARRGKAGSLNKQSTLDPFFDLSAGALANYAPRKRTTANVSKRLLAVIKQFREAEAKAAGLSAEDVEWGTMMQGLDEADPKGRSGRKREGGEDVSETGTDMTKGKTRKVAKPRRTKSGTAMSTESALEPVEDGGEPVSKPKRASKPRTQKRALSTSTTNTEVIPSGEGDEDDHAGGIEGEKAKITDISQVPVEERGKWRRQQQKSWRRAAVANSLKPN